MTLKKDFKGGFPEGEVQDQELILGGIVTRSVGLIRITHWKKESHLKRFGILLSAHYIGALPHALHFVSTQTADKFRTKHLP